MPTSTPQNTRHAEAHSFFVEGTTMSADLILFNGQFHTVDRTKPLASAVAIKDGRFVVVGNDTQAMACAVRARKSSIARPLRHSRAQRLALAPDSWWFELQPRTALGRRAIAGRCLAHAQGASRPHADPAMGARGGGLERIPVCRKTHADPRRDQPGCTGHPGIHSAFVRPRATQPRRIARGRLHP